MDQLSEAQRAVAEMKRILARASELDEAAIYASSTGITQEIRSMTLSLDTAKLSTAPLEIGFPFKSFFVTEATDSNVSVDLRLAGLESYNDLIPLKKGSTLKLPYPVRKAFLSWTAQASKTITILFFVRGEFNTNVLNLVNSGSVVIGDGDSVTVQTTGTVSTVAQLFASDTTRKKMMICNGSGLTIYLGGAVTTTDDSGTLMGLPVGPGQSYAWENTAACYAVSQGGVSTGQKIALIKFS